MDDTTLSQLITYAASAVFLVCAWATFWIWRAREAGWTRLAAQYGTKPRRDAMPRRWQTVRFMPSHLGYPGVMTFQLTVDGLYAVPTLLCRFGHDPLLIPWDDISILAVDTYPADRLYDLQLAREPRVRIRVGVKVAQFIRRAADNSQYFANPAVRAVKALPAPHPRPASLKHESVA